MWYLANTEPLRTISDRFDVSISSVFRVLRRVISWVLTKMDEKIRWPQTPQEISSVCDGFHSKQGIPHVVGAIDCTHIRIEKPLENGNDYFNRKKYCSINLQAVVDSHSVFTNVYCGEPGSLHDARVLRRSPLSDAAIENEQDLFPNNTFLLGDSAYGYSSWLVPPFRDNGRLTPQQVRFNFLHSSTRMAVERAFGLLKGRFRRIKFFTEYRQLDFITKTIIAACILHNYCIDDAWDIIDLDDEDILGNNHPQGNDGNVSPIQRDRRTLLINEMNL